MDRKVSLILLVISLFCLGSMLMLNTSAGIISAQVNQEPSVSISADTTAGTAPLTVNFTAEVNDPFTGKYPITFNWYFDDGAASTKKNPQHTFTEPGEYHVICRVTFWKSPKVTVEAAVNINVSEVQPLVVSISGNPTSGKAPLTVKFTSTVTGGSSGDKIAYKWDFGDETTSEEANPSHTFNTAGTYKVTCTVTGGTPSQTAQDTIEIDVTPSSYWPAAVCTAEGKQEEPQITADGSGGAIITWYDYRSEYDYDIYAQRISSTGEPQWIADGAAICTAESEQQYPKITSDGSGGAIITWMDYRSGNNYDIYARRIDGTGKPLWTADGVAICTAVNDQMYPQIISDGSGGAIIFWFDNRSEKHYIYAQRISSTGELKWTSNGVAVCTSTFRYESSHQIVSDGSGGAIFTWMESRSGYDIYAQRLDGTGKSLWSENGVAICTAINNQSSPRITSDGSGSAIIAWQDKRSSNEDIYAQRLDGTGKSLWSGNGVAICTADNDQVEPQITTDGSGGAIITWRDNRSGKYDIYARRIDSTGKLLWTADGVAICIAATVQQNPQITSDVSGGAIIAWQDKRTGNFNIYARRIDSEGKPLWSENGVAICTVVNIQKGIQITSDGSGGAIIIWSDYRSGGNPDIYAQHVTKDGELK
jgi:PKD repeat protein